MKLLTICSLLTIFCALPVQAEQCAKPEGYIERGSLVYNLNGDPKNCRFYEPVMGRSRSGPFIHREGYIRNEFICNGITYYTVRIVGSAEVVVVEASSVVRY